MAPPQKRTARLISKFNPSTTFYQMVFEVDDCELFEFDPGQFVAMRVDEHKVNDYSIASLPYENKFELIIDIKPGGEGSYFVKNLQEGDKIEFIGPVGSFKYKPEDGAEEIVMLATGSGIAPIKSITEHLLWRANDTRPIHVYFGLRSCSDIFLHDYYAEAMKKYPNLSFTPCLSRPDITWGGDCGHITDLLEKHYQDGTRLSAYMCGNKLMIEQAKEILLRIGTPANRIYHEAF